MTTARAAAPAAGWHGKVGKRSSGRLAGRFAELRASDEAAFVPFLMAGDRGLDCTALLLDALVEAGADVIELGVPFSDPMADGPVVQRASERALAHATKLAPTLARDKIVLVNLSGRGDKDLHIVAEKSGLDFGKPR